MSEAVDHRVEHGGHGHGGGAGGIDKLQEEKDIQARVEKIRQFFNLKGFADGEEKKLAIEEFLREVSISDRDFLGWANDTVTLDKINGVELLMATGYDLKFMRSHRVVAELFDAYDELVGQGTAEGNLDNAKIYARLKSGMDGSDRQHGIRVNKIDKNGELTGDQVDLYQYVHFKKIKEFYNLLYPEDRIVSLAELETKFFNNQPIKVEYKIRDEKGEPIVNSDGSQRTAIILDLAQFVQRPTLSKGDFDYYYNVIKKSQPSLQYLSTLRDVSIQGHHAENGGHVQMSIGLNGEYIYGPVSGKRAWKYVVPDFNKTATRFRSEGHPHEFGLYDENEGICVQLDAARLASARGGISDHVKFGEVRERTLHNLFGLNSGEAAMYDKDSHKLWFGRKEEADGSKKKVGRIYNAMHNNYDQTMNEKRGYGITEIEAGDKIMTDITAVHFAVNARDWIMTYGQLTGHFNAETAMRTSIVRDLDGQGKPELIFYAKRPNGLQEIDKDTELSQATSNSNNYGELHIKGVTALAKYVRWRIGLGDVPGISDPGAVNINIAEELTRDAAKNKPTGDKQIDAVKDQLKEVEDLAAKNRETWIYNHHEDLGDITSVLKSVYGANNVDPRDILKLLAKETAKKTVVKLSGAGQEKKITDRVELRNHLEEQADENPELLKVLKKITNEQVARSAAARFVEILQYIVDGQDAVTVEQLSQKLSQSPS